MGPYLGLECVYRVIKWVLGPKCGPLSRSLVGIQWEANYLSAHVPNLRGSESPDEDASRHWSTDPQENPSP